MEYTILTAADASTLSTQVNNLIKHGWEPQGGLALAATLNPDAGEASEMWAQAMIKHDSLQPIEGNHDDQE